MHRDAHTLGKLLEAGHAVVRIVTPEEREALDAARTAVPGSWRVFQWSAVTGLLDGRVGTTDQRPDDPTRELAGACVRMMERCDGRTLLILLDAARHLGDARTLRAWRELVQQMDVSGQPGLGGRMIMIDEHAEVPPVVDATSTRLELSFPTAAELHALVKSTLAGMHRAKPIKVDLSREASNLLLRTLSGLPERQVERIIREVVSEDRTFDDGDIRKVLSAKRRAIQTQGVLEYVEAPASMDRIAGLRKLKKWLSQRAGAMEAGGDNLGITPPRGVLLLGVQGAGKSLCAKAIATAWNRLLLRMDAGALYDKYIGESEKRLRDALHQAEAMAPVVLWIDEIEKAFAGASSTSNDGGLSRRMFGALLTWMQEHRANVFLVATANDIEALPPELLRKGRFDEIFFIDLPDEASRAEIFRIHLSKRKQDPTKLDLVRLAAASDGFSGAEIEEAVKATLFDALEQSMAAPAPEGDSARKPPTSLTLTTEHVLAVLERSPPLSVTMGEKMARLRAWGRERCAPAD